MQGESVILDATYRDKEERLRLLDLAGESKANIHFILCICPEHEIKGRLTRRAQTETEVSDGRWEIYLKQKGQFTPTDDLDRDNLIVLSTDRSIQEILQELDENFPDQAT
jgi:predicted kinase